MDKDAIFYDPHFLMLGHVVNELSRLRYSMTADDNSPEFEEPIVFPWEKQTEDVAVDSWDPEDWAAAYEARFPGRVPPAAAALVKGADGRTAVDTRGSGEARGLRHPSEGGVSADIQDRDEARDP